MSDPRSEKKETAKKLMAQAETLDELKAVIVEHKIALQGSSQIFSPRMLVQAIDRYLQDGDTRHLTSAGNFRFKVISLKQ